MTKSIDVVPTWYWPDGVPRYLAPPRSTVYRAAVERWARRTPERIALRGKGVAIDFGGLDERVRLASARIRRVAGEATNGAGDQLRLAVADASGVAGVVALLGAMRVGADTLLVDPAARFTDLAGILDGFECDLLITDREAGTQGRWRTVSLQGIAQFPAAGDDPTNDAVADESDSATLGLRWGDSIVLQPNEALLGWAGAFRAFASLEKGDQFLVTRPLSSWEALIGLLAPLLIGDTAMLPGASPEDAIAAAVSGAVVGLWLDWKQAEALTRVDRSRTVGRRTRQWVYVSVGSPIAVRERRRLRRVLDVPVLTAFGTPASGLVAASPRAWFIEEAVGIPVTGIDLVPVDGAGGHLAEPPWPLLAFANVGVKSEFLAPETSLLGAGPGRFVEPDVLDIGVAGRIDANGFLYLV